MEWLSGGREAAAEARQGGGGFPCLLKALALGEKQTAGPVSFLPGLPCLLSPFIGQGRKAGAAAAATLSLTQWEGSAGPGTGSSKAGLAWVRRGLGRG